MDLIQSYFPTLDQITEAEAQSMRQRLTTWLQLGWPDLDMRPGSVFGDHNLNASVYLMAAVEIALGRFRSDLDLEKVANGVVYDCDFVQQFLMNFAVFPKEGAPATGILRLTFSQDTSITLDRRTQIRIDGNITNLFLLRLPHPGDLLVRPVGTLRSAGVNIYPLTQTSSNLFSVDIPVYGQMETAVLAGDTAELDIELPHLVSAVALVDFQSGRAAESLSVLAERTRRTFYSASMTGRGNARHFLLKEFPELKAVSPVLSGDLEMLRGSTNPLGIQTTAVDAYVRSSNYQLSEAAVVRLEYIISQGGTSVDRFIGPLSLGSTPVIIDNIASSTGLEVSLNDGQESVAIISSSLNPERAPLLSAAYSTLESLQLSIAMPRSETGQPLIVPVTRTDGTQYSDFVVSYRSEPLVPVIQAYLESSDVAPKGVDITVKAFIPIVIRSLTISYTRTPGTTMLLDQARAEIFAYFQQLGHPDAYTDAKVADSMYYAGAAQTLSIDCEASIQTTVATMVLPDDAPAPEDDWAGCVAASVRPPVSTIRSSRGFHSEFRDPNVGTNEASFAAYGSRNIGFLLAASDIYFKEVAR